jgi:acetyltransferase
MIREIAVCIRPLRPDDREREIAFGASLSQRSRYLRLLSPLRALPPRLLDQFMNVDGDRRMALVATTTSVGSEEFVGIARYCAASKSTTAELGVAVTDAWQRCGIASLLIKLLLRFAKAHGFDRIEGFVLPENVPMLALARQLGFSVGYSSSERLMHIAYGLSHRLDDSRPLISTAP